jgi:hypothetical protein
MSSVGSGSEGEALVVGLRGGIVSAGVFNENGYRGLYNEIEIDRRMNDEK